jgi:hypothetical protein
MSHYRPECFVIGPISDDPQARKVYVSGVKAAVEALGIRCVRVDEAHFTGPIMEQVLRRIETAYFIVADLTNERPNCYYELGVAHALKKTVIHIIDKTTRKHFDVQGHPFIEFTDVEHLRRQLRERIVKLVLTTEGSDEDDYRLGKFGRSALRNGRLLTAQIEQRTKALWNVRLFVYAVGRAQPLTGKVTFYFDTSVTPASDTVTVADGLAETVRYGIYEPFTVGAKCDEGKTLLELDLSKLHWPRPA